MNEWIKRTGKQAGKLAVLLILAACVALPIIYAVTQLEPTAEAQPAAGSLSKGTDARYPNFAGVGIQPPKNGNGTNLTLWVADKTGTNYWGINPTNANLMLRTGGILYTGVTGTLTMTGGLGVLNGSSNLTFKNGMLLNGP